MRQIERNFEADLDVFCTSGHDPKLVQWDREYGECPECGAVYRAELRVYEEG